MLSIHSDSTEILNEVNKLMDIGVDSSRHPFHQCYFASHNKSDIELRTVVLRRWNLNRRSIIFHTDIRSPKVEQVRSNPSTSLLFYSKEDLLQVRFKAKSHIHTNNRLSAFMFSKTTKNQQQCYKSINAPSTKISKENHLSGANLKNPINNFSVCVSNFNQMEVLFLNHKKHIRILYEWDRFNKQRHSFLNP
ncbi:hypothetical protein DID75_05750 [Candidatus Marinamargulisbacteria bacterium SCGC AG-410-N11]|nr:hypothetical protein DID75_05750 [Candidatus Marinamargulisbacteria bacterium SCGC AG-410-N11]